MLEVHSLIHVEMARMLGYNIVNIMPCWFESSVPIDKQTCTLTSTTR